MKLFLRYITKLLCCTPELYKNAGYRLETAAQLLAPHVINVLRTEDIDALANRILQGPRREAGAFSMPMTALNIITEVEAWLTGISDEQARLQRLERLARKADFYSDDQERLHEIRLRQVEEMVQANLLDDLAAFIDRLLARLRFLHATLLLDQQALRGMLAALHAMVAEGERESGVRPSPGWLDSTNYHALLAAAWQQPDEIGVLGQSDPREMAEDVVRTHAFSIFTPPLINDLTPKYVHAEVAHLYAQATPTRYLDRLLWARHDISFVLGCPHLTEHVTESVATATVTVSPEGVVLPNHDESVDIFVFSLLETPAFGLATMLESDRLFREAHAGYANTSHPEHQYLQDAIADAFAQIAAGSVLGTELESGSEPAMQQQEIS